MKYFSHLDSVPIIPFRKWNIRVLFNHAHMTNEVHLLASLHFYENIRFCSGTETRLNKNREQIKHISNTHSATDEQKCGQIRFTQNGKLQLSSAIESCLWTDRWIITTIINHTFEEIMTTGFSDCALAFDGRRYRYDNSQYWNDSMINIKCISAIYSMQSLYYSYLCVVGNTHIISINHCFINCNTCAKKNACVYWQRWNTLLPLIQTNNGIIIIVSINYCCQARLANSQQHGKCAKLKSKNCHIIWLNIDNCGRLFRDWVESCNAEDPSAMLGHYIQSYKWYSERTPISCA